MSRTVQITVAVAAAAVLTVSTAACSSSGSKAGKSAASTPKTSAAPSSTAPAGPKPLSVAVDAKGNPSGLPAQLAAGTYDIAATPAAKALYSVQLVRLAPGYTVPALFGDVAAGIEAQKPSKPAIARLYAKSTLVGGPSGVGPQHSVVFLPQGNYVYVNTDVQGQPTPHALTVTAGATSGEMPSTSSTHVVAQGDMAGKFTFAVTGSVGSSGTLTFSNNSQDNAHFLAIVKLKPGKTVQQCESFQGDNSAPNSPCTQVLQTTIVSPAVSEQVTYTGQGAGTYLLACFMPDPRTGKVHAEEGMVKQVRVA